jgi:tRNA threonylcarbamoyladenosine biosynthesis protein TsaE
MPVDPPPGRGPAACGPVAAPGPLRRFATASPAETLDLAASLGGVLEGGETIALVGDLGSGKTTFTKGLCRGLGLADTRLVSSPTYVLEQVYLARLTVHHYDLYRLSSADELLALGFEERIGPGRVIVVEWADRAAPVLPSDRLLVELRRPRGGDGETRTVDFHAIAPGWSRKLACL